MDPTKQCFACGGADLVKERFLGADWWRCQKCHATYSKPISVGCGGSVEEVQAFTTDKGLKVRVPKRRPDGRLVRRIARGRDAKAAQR